MNLTTTQDRGPAFTRTDLLIVLSVVFMILIFLVVMPALSVSRRPARARLTCIGNLKNIALGLRLWSADHNQRFPMAVSTNKGGSLEFAGSGQVFRHFQLLADELVSPRLLACPEDKGRQQNRNFLTLADCNVSYFVGLDAIETNPRLILSGDRNVSTNGGNLSGILIVSTNTPLKWTPDIHQRYGNVALADGSVQQVNNAQLQRQVASSTNLGVRLEIP